MLTVQLIHSVKDGLLIHNALPVMKVTQQVAALGRLPVQVVGTVTMEMALLVLHVQQKQLFMGGQLVLL